MSVSCFFGFHENALIDYQYVKHTDALNNSEIQTILTYQCNKCQKISQKILVGHVDLKISLSIAEYAKIVNKFGIDSKEAQEYINKYKNLKYWFDFINNLRNKNDTR